VLQSEGSSGSGRVSGGPKRLDPAKRQEALQAAATAPFKQASAADTAQNCRAGSLLQEVELLAGHRAACLTAGSWRAASPCCHVRASSLSDAHAHMRSH